MHWASSASLCLQIRSRNPNEIIFGLNDGYYAADFDQKVQLFVHFQTFCITVDNPVLISLALFGPCWLLHSNTDIWPLQDHLERKKNSLLQVDQSSVRNSYSVFSLLRWESSHVAVVVPYIITLLSSLLLQSREWTGFLLKWHLIFGEFQLFVNNILQLLLYSNYYLITSLFGFLIFLQLVMWSDMLPLLWCFNLCAAFICIFFFRFLQKYKLRRHMMI